MIESTVDNASAAARKKEYAAVDYSDIASMSAQEMQAEIQANENELLGLEREKQVLNSDGYKYSDGIQSIKYHIDALNQRQAALRVGLSGKGEAFTADTVQELMQSDGLGEIFTEEAVSIANFLTENPKATTIDLLNWANEFLKDDETGEKGKLVRRIVTNLGALGSFFERLPEESQNFLKVLAVAAESEEFSDFVLASKKELEENAAINVINVANEYSKEHAASASFISLLKRTTGSIESAIATAGAKLNKEEISPNAPSQYRYEEAAEAQRTVSDEVIKSSVGRFFYNTGMSTADFLIASALGGKSSKAVGLIMSTKNFGATATELINKGMGTDQAVVMATGSALIEAAVEAAGVERLFAFLDNGQNLRKLLAWFQRAMAEGTEEVVSEVANSYFEKMVTGYSGEVEARKREYEKLYPQATAEEIEDMAAADTLMGLGLAFAGGFVSGGAVGGGALAMNAANVKSTTKQLQTLYPNANKEGLTELAKRKLNEPHNAQLANQTIEEIELELESKGQSDNRQAESERAGIIGIDPKGKEIKAFKWIEGSLAAVNEEGDYVPLGSLSNVDTDTLDVIAKGIEKYEGNDGAISSFVQNYTKTTLEAEAYEKAFTHFVERGENQHAYNYKTAQGAVYENALSPSVRQAAIDLGHNLRIEQSKLAPGNYPVTAEKGQYGVVKEYTRKNISKEKQTEIGLLDTFAKEMKLQIAVTDTLGQANGLYNPKTHQLVVALDAKDGGMLKAGNHEAIHYVKAMDADAYQVLEDFVIKEMKKNGADVAQRISDVQSLYMDRIGENIGKADAMEEIVADALPEILTSKKNIEAFIAQNQSAARRLLKSIKRILKKMRNTFKGSKEHEMIKASLQTYEEAVSLLEGALKHVARMNDIELETGKGAVASGLKDDVKYSLSGYTKEEFQKLSKYRNHYIAQNNADIISFIEKSIVGEDRANTHYMLLGKLNEKTVADLLELKGQGYDGADYSGYSFALDSANIRHIFIEHGNIKKETAWGQEPMTPTVLADVITAIVDYDSVKFSRLDENSKKPTFRFIKNTDSKNIAVTIVSDNKRLLVLKTAYKEKTSLSTVPDVRSTVETVQPPNLTPEAIRDPAGINSITDNEKDHNKFSIKKLEDGRQYVDIEAGQELFEKGQEHKYADVAKKYITEHFQGTTVAVERGGVELVSWGKNKYTHAKGTKSKEERSAKFKAATELDNLIKASRFLKREKNDKTKPHPNAKNGFDYYETIFYVDEKWFKGQLNVGIGELGERRFYDMNKIIEIPNPAKLSETKLTAPSRMDYGTSSDNISKAGEDVNNKDDLKSSLKTTENADTETVLKENKKLRAALQSLEGEFRLSKEKRLNETDVRRIARNLKTEYSSTINIAELTSDLNTLFTYMANTPKADMEDVFAAAANITKGVLQQSQAQVNIESAEDARELRNYLRRTPIKLTESQKAEVTKLYGSFNDYRKSQFGVMRISNAGATLDSVWQDITQTMPGYFSEDITEGNMPVVLAEVLKGISPIFEVDPDMDINQPFLAVLLWWGEGILKNPLRLSLFD